MRAPFSEMLPEIFGLSMLMRGVAAMAVSRGFVFYSRYAIHEVWLQLFSMMFILGLLGLWRRGTLPYPGCAGFCSSAYLWASARCFSICGTL